MSTLAATTRPIPPTDPDAVLAVIEGDLSARGWSVVVVPETMRTASGQHVGGYKPEYIDDFGHPYFPSAGAALTRLVTRRLGVRARYDKPGTAARMSISLASDIDLAEAYALGAAAVEQLASGETGFATILRRTSDDSYTCILDAVPVASLANKVRQLPDRFIAANGMVITSEFRRYAMPLPGTDPSLDMGVYRAVRSNGHSAARKVGDCHFEEPEISTSRLSASRSIDLTEMTRSDRGKNAESGVSCGVARLGMSRCESNSIQSPVPIRSAHPIRPLISPSAMSAKGQNRE